MVITGSWHRSFLSRHRIKMSLAHVCAKARDFKTIFYSCLFVLPVCSPPLPVFCLHRGFHLDLRSFLSFALLLTRISHCNSLHRWVSLRKIVLSVEMPGMLSFMCAGLTGRLAAQEHFSMLCLHKRLLESLHDRIRRSCFRMLNVLAHL